MWEVDPVGVSPSQSPPAEGRDSATPDGCVLGRPSKEEKPRQELHGPSLHGWFDLGLCGVLCWLPMDLFLLGRTPLRWARSEPDWRVGLAASLPITGPDLDIVLLSCNFMFET